MARNHRGQIRHTAVDLRQNSPIPDAGGNRRVDIDAAHATYYESGVLASATRVRRTEWVYQPTVSASGTDWAGRIARWLIDWCQMTIGVAICTGGTWGAWSLFGWPGLTIWLLVLAAFLTSAG